MKHIDKELYEVLNDSGFCLREIMRGVRIGLSLPVSEECYQKACLGVLESVTYDPGRSCAKSYLSRAFRNTCFDEFKRSNYTIAESQLEYTYNDGDTANFFNGRPSKQRTPENITSGMESCSLIYSSINRLPKYLRDTLMYSIDGLSRREISDKMNVPVNTVISRIGLARKALLNMTEMKRILSHDKI